MTAAQWLDHTADQIPDEFNRRSGAASRPPLVLLPRRRAVGVIRVSRVGKRKDKGERFVSPIEQRQAIENWCKANDIDLVAVFEEFSVSAHRTPLEKRRGLRPAIEMVEAAQAEVLVSAYFDRLVRNNRVKNEVIDRVEAAGGSIFALDVGQLSNATAGEWLKGEVHGMMAEHYARLIGEKTATARANAVARGVPPFPYLPPGYVRGEDGRCVEVPDQVPHVIETFKMRAAGASLTACRDYLHAHGMDISYRATQCMFTNRLYLGEIHHGKNVNLEAHKPMMDRALWKSADRAQPRGRPGKSDRLLARLGVLVCGASGCGARLTGASVWNRTVKQAKGGPRHRYAIYRCGMPGDCKSPVTIAATLVEEAVVTEVRKRLKNMSGSADLEQELRNSAAEAARTQEEFKAATLFAMDFPNDPDVQAKLASKRSAAQEASERYDTLRGTVAPLTLLSATHDWDELTPDGQRALIRRVLPRVEVLPAGSGSSRLTGMERIYFPK